MIFICSLFLLVSAVHGNGWSNEMDLCDRNDDKRLTAQEFPCVLLHMDTNYDGVLTAAELVRGWKHDGLDYTNHAPMFFLETDFDGDYQISMSDLTYLMSVFDVNGDHVVSEHEMEDGWNAFYSDRFSDGSD